MHKILLMMLRWCQLLGGRTRQYRGFIFVHILTRTVFVKQTNSSFSKCHKTSVVANDNEDYKIDFISDIYLRFRVIFGSQKSKRQRQPEHIPPPQKNKWLPKKWPEYMCTRKSRRRQHFWSHPQTASAAIATVLHNKKPPLSEFLFLQQRQSKSPVVLSSFITKCYCRRTFFLASAALQPFL